MRHASSFEIRPFIAEDRAQLVLLWEDAFPNDPARNAPDAMIESKLRLADDLLLIAHVGENVVGALVVGYDGVRGWLYHLAVASEHRRCGYATRLVREAEARLRELGCVKVNLQIRANNVEVARFYASLGYAEEQRVSMGRVI